MVGWHTSASNRRGIHPRASRIGGTVPDVVAVTGGDGFIGSHLVERLVADGHRVRAMALYSAFGTRGWLDHLPADVMAEVEVVSADVRDPRAVREFIGDASVVYHLAALIAIPYSYRAPQSYLDTNATGTLNVLEAARDLGTGRVVHTSTSEVYGTAQRVPIDESHPLQAQSPYAASKIAADKLAESYHLSFGVPVVTLRPFNTYGPRQSARAVIPTVATQLARRPPPAAPGPPDADAGLQPRRRHGRGLRRGRHRAGRTGRGSRPQRRHRGGDVDRRRRGARG